MALSAVLLTVLMSVATAMLLDYAAAFPFELTPALLLIAAGVLAINVAKFWLWGWIHRRYPFSQTYPASTAFFPIIYAIALWTGEAVLEAPKLLGTLFIVGGIALVQRADQDTPL